LTNKKRIASEGKAGGASMINNFVNAGKTAFLISIYDKSEKEPWQIKDLIRLGVCKAMLCISPNPFAMETLSQCFERIEHSKKNCKF
jgi:hypothetical protein